MKDLAPRSGRPGVYERLALRLRQLVRETHVNELSGVEKFTVRRVQPLTIEALGSDLILEDGDPDFTIGAWVRQYLLNYALHVGDQVWVLREAGQWHLVDLSDPGSQAAWRAA